MISRLWLFIILLLWFISQSHGAQPQNKPILRYNLGDTQTWVPYGYFGDSKKLGILAETLKAIVEQAGYRVKFYYYPPKRALKEFNEGQLDLNFTSPSWFKDGKMDDEIVTSIRILNLTEYIVTLPENASKYAAAESIYGKHVGTISGYNYHDAHKFIRVDFLTDSALIIGLKKQRFEAIILEGYSAQHWSKVHNLPITLASVHANADMVLGLRKELAHLLPSINLAIQTLKDEGKIANILKHYSVY